MSQTAELSHNNESTRPPANHGLTQEEKTAWFAKPKSKKKIIADMEKFMNESELDDITFDNFIKSTLRSTS